MLETPVARTLKNFGVIGVELLKKDVEKVSATGRTKDSIRFELEVFDNGDMTLTFYGREYFKTLETGRGPRRNSEYQQYDLSLEKYLEARGVPSKVSKSGIKYFKLKDSWVSAKSLAHKINKEGDETYKKGGRVVYSETLAKLVQEISRAISQDFAKFYLSEITKEMKWQ